MPATATSAQKTTMSGPHLAWATGHILVLLSALYSIFRLCTFSSPSARLYSVGYAGAILSWGIVIYKSFGVPALNMNYLRRFLSDENGEYFLLALFWFWNKPIYISLLPYATFSLFHTLGFIRQTCLPPIPSKKAGSSASQQPAPAQSQDALVKLSKSLQTWVKKNYDTAMLFVGYTEVVVVFPYIALGALLFRNSFLMPLIYARFLQLRYQLSPQTRKAFAEVDKQVVGNIVQHPSTPPIIKNAVNGLRGLVVRYGTAGMAQAPPTQPRQ